MLSEDQFTDFLLWQADLWVERVERVRTSTSTLVSAAETPIWRLTKRGGDRNLVFEDCDLDGGCSTYFLVFYFANAAKLLVKAAKNLKPCALCKAKNHEKIRGEAEKEIEKIEKIEKETEKGGMAGRKKREEEREKEKV